MFEELLDAYQSATKKWLECRKDNCVTCRSKLSKARAALLSHVQALRDDE